MTKPDLSVSDALEMISCTADLTFRHLGGEITGLTDREVARIVRDSLYIVHVISPQYMNLRGKSLLTALSIAMDALDGECTRLELRALYAFVEPLGRKEVA